MIHTNPREAVLAKRERVSLGPRVRVGYSKPTAKGRPPQRRCPDDFDVIFVEIGRLDCETWYRASRITVNRWLVQRGKRRLIVLRAAFVRHQREVAHKPARSPEVARCVDARRVHPDVARGAADFLRASRNGGWMVSTTANGDWRVGACLRSPGQLVEMAERKGFDAKAANLQAKASEGVSSAHG